MDNKIQDRARSEIQLTHLDRLESESITIMREGVACFEKPVMLYSVGKDSAVMLHLACKAFAPGKLPFPLLHVDTLWKFKEMIAFRDHEAKRVGADLLVHTNPDGIEQGIGPVTHGSKIHTDVMKTAALKQALDKYRFDAAFGGRAAMKKNHVRKNGYYRFAMKRINGSQNGNVPNLGNYLTPRFTQGNLCARSRFLTGRNVIFGNIFCVRISLCPRFIWQKSAR